VRKRSFFRFRRKGGKKPEVLFAVEAAGKIEGKWVANRSEKKVLGGRAPSWSIWLVEKNGELEKAKGDPSSMSQGSIRRRAETQKKEGRPCCGQTGGGLHKCPCPEEKKKKRDPGQQKVDALFRVVNLGGKNRRESEKVLPNSQGRCLRQPCWTYTWKETTV